MIYTPEYLAKAPKATIEITYPDGRQYTTSEALADGMLVGDILGGAGSLPRACKLGQWLDTFRVLHAKAGRSWAL